MLLEPMRIMIQKLIAKSQYENAIKLDGIEDISPVATVLAFFRFMVIVDMECFFSNNATPPIVCLIMIPFYPLRERRWINIHHTFSELHRGCLYKLNVILPKW
jgi:hypothetical protein